MTALVLGGKIKLVQKRLPVISVIHLEITKIEAKEIPCFLIPCLLVVFTRQLETLVTALVLGGKIKLVQKRLPVISVIHLIVDLEYIHLTGAHICRIFVEEEVSGLFNLIFVKKESQYNTNNVVVESAYLHCKEVCEYVLIHRITFIPKSSQLIGQ